MSVQSTLVSIVLPTFNGKKYLKDSVDSCLSQTYSNLEMIVVVDSRTTDGTFDLLKSYEDPRLFVITATVPGASNAMNLGFEQAKGEYWTWTHDDNIYLPNAMEEMVNILGSKSNVPMVRAGSYSIDRNGKILRKSMYFISCFLYRKEAAIKTGKYRHEFMESNDIDFFTRLMFCNGPIYDLHKYLHKYRLHENSLTTRQLGKKEFTTLRLHYEFIIQGIEKGKIFNLFFSQISRAAIHRNWETTQKILDFGKENGIKFAFLLKAFIFLLKTYPGWFANRVYIFFWGRYFRLYWRFFEILKLPLPSAVNFNNPDREK